MSFAHLHVHDQYSLLDGHGKIADYVKKAVKDKNPAIASTNHGNLYAIPEWEKQCNDHGIKLLPGMEAYMARHSIDERPSIGKATGDESSTGKLYYHSILLAQNQTGWKNLIKLSSRAFLEGYYRKPRIDFAMLEEHSEGLMVTSACLGGILLQEIMAGNMNAAEEVIGRFVDIFGRDRFFIEIQDHGITEQHETNPILIELAKKFKLRLVAAQDCHYLDHSDHKYHDALICVQTGSRIAAKERFRFHGDQHYLKSAQEMRFLFSDIPEACDNTLWVAEQVEPIKIIHRDSYHLPVFQVPEGFSSDAEYLRHLVIEGADDRYGFLTDTETERIEYELNVINTMGFASYFLILWDITQFCKQEGILYGPGRGSAAGSIIAYSLGLTQLDPIEYKLLFERFLNPSRISMPDIDMDFDTRYRERLINYTAAKYGSDKVCQIINFSTVHAKNAIRDSARVLGKPPSVGDQLSKLMPPSLFGRSIPLHETLKDSPSEKWADQWKQGADLRDLYKNSKEHGEILDIALGLEGSVRSTGIHAAAVVIADKPLTEYLPVQKTSKGPVTTQYDMHYVEDLGLLKMDFLGLRNLDVISDTLKLIGDDSLTMESIPLNDQATWQLLQQGLGIGVFQLESSPMRELMRKLKPESLADLGALVALYRPGPMGMDLHNEFVKRKHNPALRIALHPDAEEILDDTYQVMIYQEQMMQIAQKFAGYSLAEADSLRKATGKKSLELMQEHKAKFIEGCIQNGYMEKLARDWWNIIEPFASYSFNRSHAFCYGHVSYVTAYLKANYPAEYMSALLTSVKDKLDKAGVFLYEAEKMGMQILPPDVNASNVDFSPETGNVRFGLSAIRSIGTEMAEIIVETREKRGPFKTYDDFVRALPKKASKQNILHGLAAAGALDAFGSRGGILDILSDSVSSARREKKAEEAGMVSLFDVIEYSEVTEIPQHDLTDKEIRALEREFLGISLTCHPLKGWEGVLERHQSTIIAEVPDHEDKTMVTVAGAISNLETWVTKSSGKEMCKLVLQDFTGTIECLIFPKTWADVSLQLDQVISVKGEVGDDGTKILARSVEIINPTFKTLVEQEKQDVKVVKLHLNHDELSQTNVERLKGVLADQMYKGTACVTIVLPGKEISLPPEYNIDPNKPVILSKIRNIFNRDVFD